MSAYEQKGAALAILRRRFEEQREDVEAIDPRLCEYFRGLCYDVPKDDDADPEDPQPCHNIFEILGGVKFLRLLRTYDFNHEKVSTVLMLREGVWERDGRHWRHAGGGIKCPGTSGATVYRWQPFQVFVLASVFGFMAWIDTHLEEDEKAELLDTEEVRDGRIYDLRRLCTDFTFFAPRKTDKTGLSAFIQVVFFLLEDDNAECYCCANARDQASLLYRRTRMMLAQLDDGHRFRMTETVCDWLQAWKGVHDSSVRPLSAGGKTKDGMFAQLCCADEYGSASYTNGKSDMKMLVDVVESSMGPRREPLTFTTTTAGRITSGPFIDKLESLHQILLREIEMDEGGDPVLAYDRVGCICFEPDEWERGEEYLLTSKAVRRKVNPMLGIIAQHQYYDDLAAKARMDGDADEYVSKFMNVYVSSRQLKWITPEEIRPLQVDMRIDDCTADKGWVVFCGLDFSQGGDLHTAGYLAARSHPSGGREFFADCDAWIKEDTLEGISVRPLFEGWVSNGWLRVSKGRVFRPSLFIQRLDELIGKGVQFAMFGYDSYQSLDPINSLKAYLSEKYGVVHPESYIVPVSQTNATYNPAVDELTGCIRDDNPFIHFSPSPLWPYCFGCCALDMDVRYENKKPVKMSRGSDACKVDPVQTLCTGLILFDKFEGTRQT